MDESDGRFARGFWSAVGQLDRVIGIKAARTVVALLLHATSRSRSGYVRATYRLVERRDIAPGVLRLPARWWNEAPAVQAERLGLRWVLDLRDNLQRVLYFTGAYEPDVLARIRSALEPGAVIIDCGAHIGVHALPIANAMAKMGGGHLYAFEPNEAAADLLEQVAADNGLEIQVVRLALSDSESELTLRADDRYAQSDLGVVSEFGSGEVVATVKATAFDAWVDSAHLARVDVLKVDIEGGELAALRGMEKTLAKMRPRLVIVETKERSLQRGGVTVSEVRSFLQSRGYRLESTVPFSNDIFVLT